MSDILDAVREAGYQEGIEEGKADAKRKVALKMIADGKSNSAINHLTDLTDQEINDLRNGGEQMIWSAKGKKFMSDIMEAVREAGYQEGLKVGKARGKTKTACQVVLKMIADGYTDEKIQLYTDLFTDEINRLRQSPGNMEL